MLTKGNTFNMSKFLISAILKPFNINVQGFNFTSKSDVIGAFASGLCMMHCIATPFFFIASACSATCCNTSPIWWQRLDYIFLFVSLFAVYQGSKSSTKLWVSCGLLANWLALFVLILNTKLGWFFIAENFKFFPAFVLIGLHLYNMRYCQCESNECCDSIKT